MEVWQIELEARMKPLEAFGCFVALGENSSIWVAPMLDDSGLPVRDARGLIRWQECEFFDESFLRIVSDLFGLPLGDLVKSVSLKQ